MSGLFQRFATSERGNIAMVFAFATLGVVGLTGGSIDLDRLVNARTELQAVADSTALILAREYSGQNQETLNARAKALIESRFNNPTQKAVDVSALASGNQIKVDASAEVPTTFLSLFRYETIKATISATAVWGGNSVEIALVLDTTGSMNDSGKLAAMKAAATKAVDTLSSKITGKDKLKFSLVPFATFVNVGTGNANAGWMDTGGKSSTHWSYFSVGSHAAYTNRFSIYASLGKSWPGCVETRPAPFDVTDDAPTASNYDTYFVPALHPDEPDDNYNYANNYLSDKQSYTSGKKVIANYSDTTLNRTFYAPKYTSPSNTDYSTQSFYTNLNKKKGPDFLCYTSPIKPLTTDFSGIKAAINAIEAFGSTNVPEGLAWGWRTLSPGAPFTEGRPYDDDDNLKFIILLTDGTNSINTFNTSLGSAYSSWGYKVSNRLGSNPGTNLRNGLDTKLRTLCANTKATGIQIYSIGLMIDDSDGQQLLSDCSSGSGFYYNSPSAGKLDSIFTDIVNRITSLRLAM